MSLSVFHAQRSVIPMIFLVFMKLYPQAFGLESVQDHEQTLSLRFPVRANVESIRSKEDLAEFLTALCCSEAKK